jgi:methylated-DNA-[protein]-cysteine S-methyltransferase
MSICYSIMESPIGELLLVGHKNRKDGLLRIDMVPRDSPPLVDPGWERNDSALRPAREQLAAYFAGERFHFDLLLDLAGTPFQKRVWQELLQIPYGATISYVELARRVGQPKAARAVGSANGRNPIAIVIPCHRVIAADGSLGGYGGGLDRKKWLLDHEAAVLAE